MVDLDKYKGEKWPRTFAALPRKGDRVKSEGGKVLQVYSVVHCANNKFNDPYIEVHLSEIR
jgi:hypothetical protein